MAQLPVVEMAQQGDEWAIATLLNQKLAITQCKATVKLKNTCLKVLVESMAVPSQHSTMALVKAVLQPLAVVWVETIQVYGRQTGERSPAWTETIVVAPQSPESDLSRAPQNQSQPPRSTSSIGRSPSPRSPAPGSPAPAKYSPAASPKTRAPRSGHRFSQNRWVMPSTAPDFVMLGFMGFLALYAIAGLNPPDYGYSGTFGFIHNVNLIFHEAGHFLFSISRIFGETFLGELIYFAGGSLFQIIVPAVIVVNFWITRQYYSSAVALFWVGQNFVDVAIYIKDASDMEIPLLSESMIHDWNYILGSLNILPWDQAIGGFVNGIGVMILGLSILFGLFCVVGKRYLEAEPG